MAVCYSDVYRQHRMVNSFEQLLSNVFQPLFDATINPQQHLNIHKFLQFVSLASLSTPPSPPVCDCVCVWGGGCPLPPPDKTRCFPAYVWGVRVPVGGVWYVHRVCVRDRRHIGVVYYWKPIGKWPCRIDC